MPHVVRIFYALLLQFSPVLASIYQMNLLAHHRAETFNLKVVRLAATWPPGAGSPVAVERGREPRKCAKDRTPAAAAATECVQEPREKARRSRQTHFDHVIDLTQRIKNIILTCDQCTHTFLMSRVTSFPHTKCRSLSQPVPTRSTTPQASPAASGPQGTAQFPTRAGRTVTSRATR